MTSTSGAPAARRTPPRKQSISWIALLTLMVTQVLIIRTTARFFYGPDLINSSAETTKTAENESTEEDGAINAAINAFRRAQESLQMQETKIDGQRGLKEVDASIPSDETQSREKQAAKSKETSNPTQKPTSTPISTSATTPKPTTKPTPSMATDNPTKKPTPRPSPDPMLKPKAEAISPSKSKYDTRFQGSKITRLSMGMDMFENVCIVMNERRHAIIRTYTEDARDMQGTLGFHRNPDNHHRTYGQPLDLWYDDTAKFPLFKSDVLFTQVLYENPGHCISDYMMPLIRDRYERQTLKKLKKGTPEYPNWVRLAPRRVVEYDPKSYCSQLLQAADFVHEQGFLFNKQMCFERLYMPATEQQRFPLNEELIPIAEYEMKVGRTKLLLPGGANLAPPHYPREALREFRRTLWQNVNLKSDPWTDRETNVVEKVGPRVLFYNRFGTKQRHWKTSHEVAEILQQGYHVEIDVIGEEWNSLNFTQQAKLYNSYSHIATVHGAHLANLIFSRPGTRIVEIVPIAFKELRPDASLKRLEDAKDQRDWYGPLGWFSAFTRQVDIEHFSLPADDHITSVPGSKDGMDINATRAANFIASRFELKPRGKIEPKQ